MTSLYHNMAILEITLSTMENGVMVEIRRWHEDGDLMPQRWHMPNYVQAMVMIQDVCSRENQIVTAKTP